VAITARASPCGVWVPKTLRFGRSSAAINHRVAGFVAPHAYGYEVDFEGTGELLEVTASPHDGWRDIKVDPPAAISIQKLTIKRHPSSYVIERTGDKPGLIALTFDDGPDPNWTPAILDILKREMCRPRSL
jgi:hypothetical protein